MITDFDTAELDRLQKMKAKTEIIGDFEDLKKVNELVETLKW
jgi:hypothetical protein